MLGDTIIQATDIAPVQHGISPEPVVAKEYRDIIWFVKIGTF